MRGKANKLFRYNHSISLSNAGLAELRQKTGRRRGEEGK